MPEHGEGPWAGLRWVAGGCWALGAPCACRRAWSATRWDFSVENPSIMDLPVCFVFSFCTGFQQAGTCGLPELALLLRACCVNVSRLLV